VPSMISAQPHLSTGARPQSIGLPLAIQFKLNIDLLQHTSRPAGVPNKLAKVSLSRQDLTYLACFWFCQSHVTLHTGLKFWFCRTETSSELTIEAGWYLRDVTRRNHFSPWGKLYNNPPTTQRNHVMENGSRLNLLQQGDHTTYVVLSLRTRNTVTLSLNLPGRRVHGAPMCGREAPMSTSHAPRRLLRILPLHTKDQFRSTTPAKLHKIHCSPSR
jgi:hypothetical protein